MKKILTALCLSALMPLTALAQHEEDTENGLASHWLRPFRPEQILFTSASER